jgi:5-formyltetrahydrofolate cyclo-ligase
MNEDIQTKKKNLRKKILALRDALSQEERKQKSSSIHKHLFSLPEFSAAQTVAFFISFKSEVLTERMIRDALSLSKQIVVPITDLTERRLVFSRLIDFSEDLIPGTWGILEPKPACVRPVAPEEIDLVITPGAVFDLTGNRIGYGGGFYDGLLTAVGKPSVGLAFSLQIIEHVPALTGHDVPVDMIITEEGITRCKGSGQSQSGLSGDFSLKHS